MKEKFKKYLEEQFRNIRPTYAAMQFREETLANLMDRAQELKIKGIDDEELIYLTCIDELGDFQETLKEFDEKEVKTDAVKRKVSLGAVIAVAVAAVLTLTYLIVGFVAHVWHPTWLIMVGGVFAGAITAMGFVVPKLVKNKKYIVLRAMAAVTEVLVSVFVFLILQLVVNLSGAWMTFLAMVALILGVDTAIAFVTANKFKFVELPIFVEVFFVMLFVILGIVTKVWHPLWLLCLVGVLFALGEIIAFVAIRNKEKEAKETEKINKKHVKEDESYYTTWKD